MKKLLSWNQLILFGLFIIFGSLLTERLSWACDLQVIVPDVGMGQAIVLLDGKRAILIDTGPEKHVQHLHERMAVYGVNHLDHLFLTHFHPDHAGGYGGIRRFWPHTLVYTSGHFPHSLMQPDKVLVPEIMAALKQDPLHRIVNAGDSIQWEGNRLNIIWPEIVSGNNLNAMSLVLLIQTECGKNLLIMGDVDKNIEHGLIPDLKLLLKNRIVDILVVGHHGAIDSTDPELIQMIRPRRGIVSVGKNNSLGYPAKNVMTRLNKFCGKVLRTDKDGEFCFQLSAAGPVDCRLP